MRRRSPQCPIGRPPPCHHPPVAACIAAGAWGTEAPTLGRRCGGGRSALAGRQGARHATPHVRGGHTGNTWRHEALPWQRAPRGGGNAAWRVAQPHAATTAVLPRGTLRRRPLSSSMPTWRRCWRRSAPFPPWTWPRSGWGWWCLSAPTCSLAASWPWACPGSRALPACSWAMRSCWCRWC